MTATPQACLAPLIEKMQAWCMQDDRYKRIAAHIAQSKPEHPLSEEEQGSRLQMAAATLNMPPQSASAIEEGQPFRLGLLSHLARITQDIDKHLPSVLAQGVPTGVFEPIVSSNQWPAVDAQQAQHPLDTCLKEFDTNWKNAEAQPDLLQRLIEEEMAQGWVIEIPGGEQEARAKWPKGIAIGKLNVVQADGKDPRMVLDSSVCNVNPRCTLPERVCLPTAADVRTTFKPHDPPNASQGAALDFKAAHKRVKVRHSDQGLLLFRNAGRLYAYVVCHFGARFSAYWWQRVGALLLRLLHRLMAPEPHKAWLYVDDLLLSLLHCRAPQQLAFVVAYLSLIGAPISWKKASFGPRIIWCGWQFCFRTETVCLAQPKLDKLRAQLLQLLQHKRVPRKELEACLGLLMWATSISPHLRCFTAPIYSDLHSPPGTCYPVPPRSWSQFLWCLDASCRITKDASYLQLPLHAKVIEVKGKPVRAKTDIWPIPAADKTIWVRIADPSASEITLRNESKAAIHWLAQCFAYEFAMPLARQPLLPCLSAADAMADGTTVGIGGWLSTSSHTWWFAQQWDIKELRTAWPFLTKDAQQ